MKIVAAVNEMQRTADEVRLQGKRIAVVPTMGYLHEGHLSLIRLARSHADVVVTTIFVNPTQFGPGEDFSRYPRDLARDTKLAESAGTDILFTPSVEEMYPAGWQTFVTVEQLTSGLEGTARPGHFKGVTTIVAKLFNCTKPHVAVFGQKDAQQAAVIGRMVNDLNIDVRIIVAPIVREPDGLAMSSRNVYLSPAERRQSLVLYQALNLAKRKIEGGERRCASIVKAMSDLISTMPAAATDYISIADSVSLKEFETLHPGDHILVSLAVRIGSTRLIDNTLLSL